MNYLIIVGIIGLLLWVVNKLIFTKTNPTIITVRLACNIFLTAMLLYMLWRVYNGKF